jgi:ATP-dependent Lon protease
VSDLLELGLFPLGLVLLPGERIPLHIFERRYRALAADCILEGRPFVLVLTGEGGVARVGCTARFETLLRRFVDGRMNVAVAGEDPVEIVEEVEGRAYLSARVRPLEDRAAEAAPEDVEEALGLFRSLTEQVTGAARDPDVPEGVPLSYALAGAVDLGPQPKQELLESRDESERLVQLRRILRVAQDGIDRSRVAAERAQSNGKVVAP